jgi:hypothetical protein
MKSLVLRSIAFVAMLLALVIMAGAGNSIAQPTQELSATQEVQAPPDMPRNYAVFVPGAGTSTGGPTITGIKDGVFYVQDTISYSASVVNTPFWPKVLAGGAENLQGSTEQASDAIVAGFEANEHDPNYCPLLGHSLGGIGARLGGNELRRIGECNMVEITITGSPVSKGSIMDNIPNIPALGVVIPDGADAEDGVKINLIVSQADCYAWSPNFLQNIGSVPTCLLGIARDHYNMFVDPDEGPIVYGTDIKPDVSWTEGNTTYYMRTTENPAVSFIDFVGTAFDRNWRLDEATAQFIRELMPMRPAGPVDPDEVTIRGLVEGKDQLVAPAVGDANQVSPAEVIGSGVEAAASTVAAVADVQSGNVLGAATSVPEAINDVVAFGNDVASALNLTPPASNDTTFTAPTTSPAPVAEMVDNAVNAAVDSGLVPADFGVTVNGVMGALGIG